MEMVYIMHHPVMGFLLRFLFLTGSFWLALGFACPDLARGQSASSYSVLPLNSVWKYNASGFELGTVWRNAAYDDSAWPMGRGRWGRSPATYR